MISDLHCHSKVSDGSLTIVEIVGLAKRMGINALAIADHDTVNGLEEAEEECKKQGLKNIPAIEISGYDYKRDKKAHILGYMMDRPQDVGAACRPIVEQREEVSKWIVDRLIHEGYPITWEFVLKISSGSTNVYKQHIMHALMEYGYAASIHDDLYKKLFAKPKNGLSGGIVYREIEYMDVKEAVKVIKEAGGIAVLAHPVGYGNIELIPELVEIGLDGLEAWHPSHNKSAVEEVIKCAKEYQLILTGGSDFHGMYEGEVNNLGCCNTPVEYLEILLRCKDK